MVGSPFPGNVTSRLIMCCGVKSWAGLLTGATPQANVLGMYQGGKPLKHCYGSLFTWVSWESYPKGELLTLYPQRSEDMSPSSRTVPGSREEL